MSSSSILEGSNLKVACLRGTLQAKRPDLEPVLEAEVEVHPDLPLRHDGDRRRGVKRRHWLQVEGERCVLSNSSETNDIRGKSYSGFYRKTAGSKVQDHNF